MGRLVSAVRLPALAVMAGLLASAASAASTFEVVLATGERVVASSRPLLAMGKVSFLDQARRPVTLPTSVVDVKATREALGASTASGRVWDEKSLDRLGDQARIQFYGDAPVPAEGSGEPPAEKPDANASPAQRLRAEIGDLMQQIRVLPTTDRRRSLLVIRQRELQQELGRVLDSPSRG